MNPYFSGKRSVTGLRLAKVGLAMAGVVATAALTVGSPVPAQAATTQSPMTKSIDVTQVKDGTAVTIHVEFDKPVSRQKARQVLGSSNGDSSSGAEPRSPLRMSSDGSTAILHCGRPKVLSTGKGSFHLAHPCGSSSVKWGYRINTDLQKHVVGKVHESGMRYARNGGDKKTGKAHMTSESHYFSGKFSPARHGDTGTYHDTFKFLTNYSFGGVSHTKITVSGSFNVAS